MNNKLILAFVELQKYYKSINDTYRIRAYTNAIQILKKYPREITSATQVTNLSGIGKSIGSKVQELLETGQLEILKTLPQVSPKISPVVDVSNEGLILKEFQKIYGVGPVTAKKWYDQDCRNFEDLKKIKMTRGQTLGYKYFADLQQRIPKDEVKLFDDQIQEAWPKEVQFTICGSYRRGLDTCGDIDILIYNDSKMTLKELIVQLEKKLEVHKLSFGQHKFSGLCRLNSETLMRRIDVLIIPPESWPYALLYFTGNQSLNIQMRNKANEFGWTLNEYGLTSQNLDDMEKFRVGSEREIFGLLEMDYLGPEERCVE